MYWGGVWILGGGGWTWPRPYPLPITCVTALALECRVVWTTPHASEREPYIYCFSVQMNQVIHGYPFLVVQNYPIISMLFGTMVHLNHIFAPKMMWIFWKNSSEQRFFWFIWTKKQRVFLVHLNQVRGFFSSIWTENAVIFLKKLIWTSKNGSNRTICFPEKSLQTYKNRSKRAIWSPKNIPSISCERGCLDNPAFQRKRRFARNG